MPFVLLLFGTILFVAGINNQQSNLWTLVKGDFTGSNNFGIWIAAIAVVGGVGYIKSLRTLSVAFMTLLLLVLVLSNKGIFAQLQGFVLSPTVTPIANTSGTDTQYVAALAPNAQVQQNLSTLPN